MKRLLYIAFFVLAFLCLVPRSFAAVGDMTNYTPSPAFPYSNVDNLAVDSSGNVWVVDPGNALLYKFSPSGSQLATYSPSGLGCAFGGGGYGGVAPIVYDGTNMWIGGICSSNLSAIKVTSSGSMTAYQDPSGMGSGPVSVVYDGANLWFGEYYPAGYGLSKYSIGGNSWTDYDIFDSYGPVGFLGWDGTNVWMELPSASVIGKFSPSLGYITNTYSPSNPGWVFAAFAFDGTYLWRADGDGTVSKITPSTGAITTYGGLPSQDSWIAFDGTNMWVTSLNNGVYSVSPSGGVTTIKTYSQLVSAGALYPGPIAFDGNLNMWMTNDGSYNFSKIVAWAQTVPSAPTIGTARINTGVSGSVIVPFGASASNGHSPITGYTAVSSPGNITGTCASSPCTVSGLTGGTSYTFSVYATNGIGNSSNSSASNSVTAITAPGAPTGVTATAGAGSASVSFTAPGSNGGATITGYYVQCSPSCTQEYGVTSPIIVTGLTGGQAYTFQVEAYNNNFYSSWSSASGAVTPSTYSGTTASANVLVVAGGGGGGQASVNNSGAGGGGAGGLIYKTSLTVNFGQAYTVVVGSGGAAAANSVSVAGSGGNSSFTGVLNQDGYSAAIGGGGGTGGDGGGNGANGGSGGGAGDTGGVYSAGGSGTGVAVMQGFSGGHNGTSGGCGGSGGGGGGNAGPGGNGITCNTNNPAGGYGTYYWGPSGTLVNYANGGVGGGYLGGAAGAAGTANTGNGGAGGQGGNHLSVGAVGGAGGSGVVIISIPTTAGVTATGGTHTSYGGNDVWSFTSSGTWTPSGAPGTPTIGTATGGNGSASVAFTPGPVGGGSVTYVATSNPGNFTGSGASSPVTVNGLTNGTSYTFTVYATNSYGTSANSAASNAVTPATVPGPPTIGTALPGNNSAVVQFTPPGSNGGATTTSYTATSNPGNFTGTGSASPITVSGLSNGTSYTFTVYATNAKGNGASSAASNAVVPTVVCPSALTGTVTITVSCVFPGVNDGVDGGITVNTGATLTINSGQTIAFNQGSSFRINGSGSVVIIGTGQIQKSYLWMVDADNDGWPATLAVTAATSSPGGIYKRLSSMLSRTVVDCNDNANSVSNTCASTPGAPTIGTATGGNGSASVAFVPGAANGSPITGFTATSQPGGLTGSCAASPCTVSGLSNGTSYTFTVYATNALGNGPSSAASNAVTPSTIPGAPTNPTVTQSTNVSLSWVTAPSNGSPITSYKVYRGASPGGEAYLGSVSNSPYSDGGSTTGHTYYYKVSAVNANGEGALSSEVSATCGTYYLDADGDGYTTGGSIQRCAQGTSLLPWSGGFTYRSAANGNDCNDGNASVWQNLTAYEDDDGDGYGASSFLVCSGASLPSGYLSQGGDCNDQDQWMYPGSPVFGFYGDAQGMLDYNCDGQLEQQYPVSYGGCSTANPNAYYCGAPSPYNCPQGPTYTCYGPMWSGWQGSVPACGGNFGTYWAQQYQYACSNFAPACVGNLWQSEQMCQ
jgi:hypothetical protein